MKKVFLLVVTLMLVGIFAVSESVYDFSGYSTDDLIFMRAELSKEILNRLDQSISTIYEGFYVAGVDIPAGEYLVSYAESEHKVCRVWIYESEEQVKTDRLNPKEMYDVQSDDHVRVRLTDGMVLRIQQAAGNVQHLPKASWAQ